MKIFVINLESSISRRIQMEKQLHALKLPYELFSGVDGASLSEAELAQYYDISYFNEHRNFFTPGVIGCAISHYLIYKKMVDEKIEKALILEDDMVLSKEFPELLSNIENKVRDHEVIMLFYQCYIPLKLSTRSEQLLTGKFKIYQTISTKWLSSTGGYALNMETAKSLTKGLKPIYTAADDWENFYKREILNGIRVVYPFILENSYQQTTINRNTKGTTLANKILFYIENQKIFPFYEMLKWRRKLYIKKTRKCVLVNEEPVDFRENIT